MTPPPLVVEALDPARHNCQGFSSGVAQVDNFLRRTAGKLTRANNLRTFVLADADATLIGFYAVNAHVVNYASLPARFVRDRPSHGGIPAAFIAMIGVDRRFQGRGHGGDLLVDCLRRIARAADSLGIAVILLDVLDCGDPRQVGRRRALYASYGFQPLPSDPLRLFMPIATARSLLSDRRDVTPPHP